MRNVRRWIVTVLLSATILSLCACSDSRGITARYDGYTVRTEKAREETAEPVERNSVRSAYDETAEDYVLNKNSMKFHYPSCSGASGISESNRRDYHGTRESVLDMGYSPCSLCNP